MTSNYASSARVSYDDLAARPAIVRDVWHNFLLFFSRRGGHFCRFFRFLQFSLSDCSLSVVLSF